MKDNTKFVLIAIAVLIIEVLPYAAATLKDSFASIAAKEVYAYGDNKEFTSEQVSFKNGVIVQILHDNEYDQDYIITIRKSSGSISCTPRLKSE